jgi:hypothetical protein
MENENTADGKMENIFYAALALHVAGKPINKENIRVVMRAAGTPIDEPALDIIAAFMASLKASHLKNDGINDPRVIKILTSALTQHKMQVEQLEALLEEMAVTFPPNPKTPETTLIKLDMPELRKEANQLVDSGIQTAAEELTENSSKTILPEPANNRNFKGRYVYGITAGGKEISLGPIGIDGSVVYTLGYQDLGAIVHDCPIEPYQSLDDEKVKGWVKAHQNVLDTAKEQFKIIIPLGFDTILKSNDDFISPEQVVRNWLANDYERLHGVITRIEGRDEYAVQISYIPSEIKRHMPEPSQEVVKIQTEIAKKSPGIAYIYKQKLEKTLKADMENLVDGWFKDFFNRIKLYADDIIIEKTRKLDNEMVMLLNLSCLVAKEKVESLGEELEKINNMEGFSVHFSGPWPPYSFVAKPIATGRKEGIHESN